MTLEEPTSEEESELTDFGDEAADDDAAEAEAQAVLAADAQLAQQADVQAMHGAVEALANGVDADAVMQNLQDAVVNPVQPPDVVAGLNPDPAYQNAEALVERLFGRFRGDGEAARKARLVAKRFFGALSGVVTVGTLAGWIIKALSGDKAGTEGLPPECAAKVKVLVDAWRQLSDVVYWRRLARYVSQPATRDDLTLADQVCFMNLTIVTSPSGPPFQWDSEHDKQVLIEELRGKYSPQTGTAEMYRRVAQPDFQYHGKAIPRATSADLLRSALVLIIDALPERRA